MLAETKAEYYPMHSLDHCDSTVTSDITSYLIYMNYWMNYLY